MTRSSLFIHPLSTIAAAYGKVNAPRLSHKVLAKALAAATEEINVLENALTFAQKIDENHHRYKAEVLRSTVAIYREIAVVYWKINDPKLAHKVLKNALAIVEKIDDLGDERISSKSEVLSTIAAAYGELNNPKLAQEGLQTALTVAKTIDDLSSKSEALSAIAAAYGELNNPKLAQEVLKNALSTAENIDDPSSKSKVLSTIAAAYGELNNPKLAQEGLKNALAVSEAANAEEVLARISLNYAYLSDWGQALNKGFEILPRILES